MLWFEYDQNNSGGSFVEPAHLVFIEAESAAHADDVAEELGIYFDDDCEVDCPCCGPRWGRAYEGVDVPQAWSREDRELKNLLEGPVFSGFTTTILLVHADGSRTEYKA